MILMLCGENYALSRFDPRGDLILMAFAIKHAFGILHADELFQPRYWHLN